MYIKYLATGDLAYIASKNPPESVENGTAVIISLSEGDKVIGTKEVDGRDLKGLPLRIVACDNRSIKTILPSGMHWWVPVRTLRLAIFDFIGEEGI